jgi:hypothetical protein
MIAGRQAEGYIERTLEESSRAARGESPGD